MDRLVGTVQNYAWGSSTAIAQIRGREPSGQPEAELWLGAHPGAPSSLDTDAGPIDLLDLIERDAEAQLGDAVVETFGEQLPFLLKILAAAEPLSLQAHPSSEQAIVGFARENDQGIAVDAPNRSFRDRSHKPELICALTDFWALCGFREATETVALLRSLAVDGALDQLVTTIVESNGLGDALEHLLTMPSERSDALARTVADACRAVTDGPFAEECRWAATLADKYPGDVGVVTALLMNLVCLSPGDALFLEAGNLHAYLEGTGVEIMANSDNVLRGGLTPKHMDIPALLEVVVAESLTLDVQRPAVIDGRATYDIPVPEFGLERLETRAEPLHLDRKGPEILLCVSGTATVVCGDRELSFASGQSVFVAAADESVSITIDGTVFRAHVGKI